MAKVIRIVNQKGGVEKTNTTANLGYGLSRNGYKVLLIDCDPQASLTISLGINEPDTLEAGLPEVLDRIMGDKLFMDNDCIFTHDSTNIIMSREKVLSVLPIN